MGKLYEYILRVKQQGVEKLRQFAQNAGVAENRGERLKRTNDRLAASSRQLSGVLGNLKSQILTVFAVSTLMAFGGELISTTARAEGLRNAITFVSGSTKEAEANFSFLDNTSQRMGLNLEASQEGFKTLSAAMMGSKLQGQATRDIFEGVATGAAAMNLGAEETKGAFLALGQMMGKGKVSAEELRGQLGERIPGAFQIAARAMGVSTAKLDDMMKKGELVSSEFLPRFAAEMKRTFEGALPQAMNSLQANLNRFNNEWFKTKEHLGKQMQPTVMATAKVLTYLMQAVRSNWTEISILLKVVAFAGAVFAAYKLTVWGTILATRAYALAATTARLAVILFTGGFSRLNMVMRLNPIGLIVSGLMILIGLFVLAYNKIDWFRGGVHGLWESMKELGSIMLNGVVKIFKGLFDIIVGTGQVLWNFFNLDFDGAEKAAAKVKDGFKGLAEGIVDTNPVGIAIKHGEKLAGKFREGYDKGLKAGPIDVFGAMGMSDPAGAPTTTATNTETKDGITEIAAGGHKSVNVTVNVGKFLDKIEVHNNGVAESISEVEVQVREFFTRILNAGVQAASQ